MFWGSCHQYFFQSFNQSESRRDRVEILWPVNMTEDHFKPCKLRKSTVKQLKPGLCEISDSNNISFRSVICICVWLGLILKIPKQTKFRQHFQINNISVKEKNKE